MNITVTLYNLKDQVSRSLSTSDWVEAMEYVDKHHERSCRVGISVNSSPETILGISDSINLIEVKG